MYLRALLSGVAGLITLGTLTASCSSSSAAPELAPDGGDGSAPSQQQASWSAGACGACVTTGCAAPRQVCDAEPSCAAHASCSDKCGSDATGSIDAACLAACPRGDNAVASRGRAAYDTCLTGASVKGCTACPATGEPLPVNDLLNQSCSTSTETNACFKCEDLSCCKTFEACVAEPACKQQLQPCLTACKGDLACEGTCYESNPKGVAAWARRQTCMLVRCAADCGGTPDACLDCSTKTTCRESFARCTANEGCFLLNECIKRTCPGNTTDSCIDGCKGKAPASASLLLDAWLSCVTLSCTSECT